MKKRKETLYICRRRHRRRVTNNLTFMFISPTKKVYISRKQVKAACTVKSVMGDLMTALTQWSWGAVIVWARATTWPKFLYILLPPKKKTNAVLTCLVCDKFMWVVSRKNSRANDLEREKRRKKYMKHYCKFFDIPHNQFQLCCTEILLFRLKIQSINDSFSRD
jgi:hypothetical protein